MSKTVQIEMTQDLYDLLYEVCDITGYTLKQLVAVYLESDQGKPILDCIEKLMKGRVEYVNQKLDEFRDKMTGE